MEVVNLAAKEKKSVIKNAQKRVLKNFNLVKQQQEFINFYKRTQLLLYFDI